MIKMKSKIVIHNYKKFRWKHSSYKEKANKKLNKRYPNLDYHGNFLELQFKYLLFVQIYLMFTILFNSYFLLS